MRTTKAALAAAFLSAALLIGGCGQGGSQSGTDPGTAGRASPAPEGKAGNGISEKSPDEIITAAGSAFRSAESVRVKLDLNDAGKLRKGDLKLTQSGDMSGWMEEDGLRMDLIVTDGTVYIRSRDLWEQEAPEAVELFGNRWVKVPVTDAKEMAPFTEDLTIKGLAKLFDDLDPPTFVRKSEETVAGQPVVRLKGSGGLVDVMATGEPYPLRLEGKAVGENEESTIRFSNYGENFKIKAPANPLDPSELGG
jgi:hypothetical protein